MNTRIMPARIVHNEGTITGSKEHVYTEFILVGGGNLNHGGQVIKNFARIKCKTNVIISIGAGNIKDALHQLHGVQVITQKPNYI